jgi:hypothetical protein
MLLRDQTPLFTCLRPELSWETWKLDDQGFIRALRQHRGVLERNNVSLGKKAKGLAAGGLWHPDGQVL